MDFKLPLFKLHNDKIYRSDNLAVKFTRESWGQVLSLLSPI